LFTEGSISIKKIEKQLGLKYAVARYFSRKYVATLCVVSLLAEILIEQKRRNLIVGYEQRKLMKETVYGNLNAKGIYMLENLNEEDKEIIVQKQKEVRKMVSNAIKSLRSYKGNN